MERFGLVIQLFFYVKYNCNFIVYSLRNIIPIAFLTITFTSIGRWSSLTVGTVTFWWSVFVFLIFQFIRCKKVYYDPVNNKNIDVIKWLLFWTLISVIRGCFVADNYWEWKNLPDASMALSMPVTFYLAANKTLMQQGLKVWFYYALPFFFLFLLVIHNDAIGHYLVPVGFMLPFFRVVNTKWKLILLFFAVFVILYDFDARSNVIKFSVLITLGLFAYFRNLFGKSFLNLIRWILLLAPFVFFTLGISGIFNIFDMEKYSSTRMEKIIVVDGKEKTVNLKSDTRSGIYTEVIESALKNKYYIFGRTPARGADSNLFGGVNLKLGGRAERFSYEASVLNIFTWNGIIGVILYFLVFFKASHLAINRSNNYFIKLIGVFVAFRWLYAWIEDFTLFNSSSLFLWLSIGMCLSNEFRRMNNKEISIWVRGVFSNK